MTGKRGRGRKRIGMLDKLIEESYVELKMKAQDGQFGEFGSHGPANRQNTNNNNNNVVFVVC